MFQKLTAKSTDNGWTFVREIKAENNYRGRGVYYRIAENTKQ